MESFDQQLQFYKQHINTDIEAYAAHAQSAAYAQFGQYSGVVTDAFFDMLRRGGKRLRGALVLAGYEMCGGRDTPMIVRAATAIEMVHASLLILDDIQDRSSIRRGKPTVHEMLAAYHREQGFRGDAAHTGTALAVNAGLAGCHAAQMLAAGLQVEPLLRSNALGIIAQAIVTTAHGQTQDFVQEVAAQASMEDIEHTMEWKTAYYTVLNPLCVGMVLAGAGCEDTDAIREYALHTGKAFQITDDLIGVFGNEQQTGKDVMDDIREGKQTLLVAYALEHAGKSDVEFLRSCLGNSDISEKDFAACRQLIETCGARRYAEKQSRQHARAALQALKVSGRPDWRPAQVDFLRGLVTSLQQRAA